MPIKLSLIIIAQNEEEDLGACLTSAREVADEMIVIEGGSTDRTAARAASLGARVVPHPFQGFVEQKEFALEQAQGEWVLSLDADERLSPELAREIIDKVKGRPPEVEGFLVSRWVEFLGRRLRHGGLAKERLLRLFRRRSAHFTGGQVHERVEVQGPLGLLKYPIWHRPYRDLSEYLEKLDRYTELAARQAWQDGRRFRTWDHAVLPLEFAKRYLFQGGCLDGGPGFVWCALSSLSAWIKRVKLYERTLQSQAPVPKTIETAGKEVRG